jgi:ADP-heptose:LPS heptosyltransferase
MSRAPAALVRKVGRFLWWRWDELRRGRGIGLAGRVGRRWGWGALRLRYPLALAAPYRRRTLHVERGGQLGDVLLCTPALRAVRQANPDCRIVFYTAFPSLVEGLPFVDEVCPPRPDGQKDGVVVLGYEKSRPPHRHLARIIGDDLGLDVRDVRPSCVLDEARRDRFREAWADLPRPWVVITRRASKFTPNKDWPDGHWEILLDRLLERGATVIEVGTDRAGFRERSHAHYVDLIGRTTLAELVAATAAADLHVGPISGPVHIAAAFGVPAVVIYGGYEHPCATEYPGNVNFYSPVPCAPCWLKTPCPYDRKCLQQISPQMVLDGVDRVWAERQPRIRDTGSGAARDLRPC